ncbi:MAG: chaperone modulatory protein CbpM [Halioglobus sp.]|nr:chaperone modulatory protein CbpM [Halioglobus sp.]
MLRVSITEFCEREGVDNQLVATLVELEVAHPVGGASVEEWVFDATGAHWLEKSLRLRRDLQLEWEAVGMLVQVMRQREELRRENEALRRRLARFLSD